MATFKNTSGDLTLTGDGGLATLTINYANTIFNGSFTYTGNLTTVDDFITVAANNTGTITDMGLLAQTGTGTFAGLRFDTTANTWQISNSVTSAGVPIASYANISTTVTNPGGPVAAIQFKTGNTTFGGNVNLLYDFANNQFGVNAVQFIGYQPTPTAVANAVAINGNVAGSGKTGLYFTSVSNNGELISATQAKLYAIIF